MDVAVIWQHCAGGAESSCDSPNDSYSALNKIKNDRKLLDEKGLSGAIDLVFLQDTFTAGGNYSAKFTLQELQDYSCEFLATGALDGFAYYTWDEGWYSGNLKKWTDLWPAVSYVKNTCTGGTAPAPIVSPTPIPTPVVKLGDANNDGLVNEIDYNAPYWLSHYGQTVSGGMTVGDFNASGKVDGVDYVIWLTNYGK